MRDAYFESPVPFTDQEIFKHNMNEKGFAIVQSDMPMKIGDKLDSQEEFPEMIFQVLRESTREEFEAQSPIFKGKGNSKYFYAITTD